jgi:hypothetical protein
MTRWMLVCVLGVYISQAQQGVPQAPTFHAVAESVQIPVAVTQNGRPVSGLAAGDFEVLDNGVRQRVDVVSLEALPIDVTVLADLSGSITPEARQRFSADVERMRAVLHDTDRVQVIGFGHDVADLSLATSGAGTSLYDALAAALLTRVDGAGPHLVVALTDGRDTTSLLGLDDVASLADHTLATVFMSVVRTPRPFSSAMVPWSGELDLRRLRAIVERTGGQVVDNGNEHDRARVFEQILRQYRTMYLLRYTPEGVERDGWHSLTVRVPAHNYRVTARAGYR